MLLPGIPKLLLVFNRSAAVGLDFFSSSDFLTAGLGAFLPAALSFAAFSFASAFSLMAYCLASAFSFKALIFFYCLDSLGASYFSSSFSFGGAIVGARTAIAVFFACSPPSSKSFFAYISLFFSMRSFNSAIFF